MTNVGLVVDYQESEAWDRQPSEPSKAHGAFRIFRDMPAMQRNLDSVAAQIKVSPRQCRRWAEQWGWRDRAIAWDDACHRIEDRERLEAIRQMHSLHRTAARLAVGKAVQALQGLHPTEMPPSLIARLLDLGTRLERQTLTVSVEELQGRDSMDDDSEDAWERIARELDNTPLDISDEQYDSPEQ